MAINASIVGATGYTGQELIDILLGHPHVRLAGLYSTTDEPKPIGALVRGSRNGPSWSAKNSIRRRSPLNPTWSFFACRTPRQWMPCLVSKSR